MFLNVCVEFPSPNDPIHRAGMQHYCDAKGELAEVARQAGAQDPELLAEQLIVLMQGTLTHRQVSGDNDAAAKARDVAEAMIERAVN